MTQFNTTETVTVDDGLQDFLLKVFTQMGIGLLITTVVAWIGYNSLATGGMLSALFGSSFVSLILIVVQLGFCIALSAGLTKFSTAVCTGLFYGYALITGITFSVLPYTYDFSTLFTAFGFAAIMFASCAVIGRTTKVDLTRFSGLLFGALIAMALATLASLFIPALRQTLIISYIGVILFLALTAFDVQKLKNFYYQADGQLQSNLAVYGAFQLYLDFINLFLQILRIVARNRSNRK